jgi:hypothetical protein
MKEHSANGVRQIVMAAFLARFEGSRLKNFVFIKQQLGL